METLIVHTSGDSDSWPICFIGWLSFGPALQFEEPFIFRENCNIQLVNKFFIFNQWVGQARAKFDSDTLILQHSLNGSTEE